VEGPLGEIILEELGSEEMVFDVEILTAYIAVLHCCSGNCSPGTVSLSFKLVWRAVK
jgi:hypothetical protein